MKIVLAFLGFLACSLAAELTDSDAEALCQIIESVQGLPADWQCSNGTSGRDSVSQQACNAPWRGLTCTNPGNTTAAITALELTGISGVLPPELGMLEDLRTLKLSGTGLTGPLPDTMNNLRYLITMDISGTSISGGCFPQSLINNEVFSNCRAPDTSFACACDAPVMCRSKKCCPTIGGLEEAGLVCNNGEWEVPEGKHIEVEELFLQDEIVAIGADMNVTGHFELRRASFVLTGDLKIGSETVIIAGLASNLTVNGCLYLNDQETTLILQLLEEDTVTDDLEWTFISAKDDCIRGAWKEVVVESITYNGCLQTDSENITHPGSIILNVAGECSSGIGKEAILGIVFGLLIGLFVLATIFYVFNNQEAYEHVFPDRVYKPISNPENF